MRPAVADDVVHREEHPPLRLVQPHRRDPQQRARAPGRTAAPPPPAPGAAPPPRATPPAGRAGPRWAGRPGPRRARPERARRRRVEKAVRSVSWRRTISVTARSSTAGSKRPRRRSAEGMLYAALPGSSWSMNHSRCCANDSGSADPSRGSATSGGACVPSSSAWSDSMRPASPATVGASKSARSGSSTPNACRTRETTRVASSECPPSPKKSSSTPTRSSPSTSPQIPASISSGGGAWRHVHLDRSSLRCGERTSVQLPVGRQREGVEHHQRGRHHVLREPLAKLLPQPGRVPARRHHVAHQAPIPRAILPRQHHRFAHRGLVQQRRLDLPRLDPEARAASPAGRSGPGTPALPRQATAPGHPCGTSAHPPRRRTGPAGSARPSARDAHGTPRDPRPPSGQLALHPGRHRLRHPRPARTHGARDGRPMRRRPRAGRRVQVDQAVVSVGP